MREKMQLGGVRAAIESFDADADVFWTGLGILDKYVPVAVVVEDTGVEEFVLRTGAIALVLFQQFGIGVLTLRVLVEHAHVAMRRRAVEVKPIFLDVFSVNAFVAGKAEHAFF